MSNLVVPGQSITSESGFLRGHGTYLNSHPKDSNQIVLTACVAGEIDRVNRLVSVKPLKSRYLGEVGDLIVGRISSVESKRWKVDIAGHREAVLQLSSITLPGGVQRMKTYEDQLQMRTLFQENDLICAEIQNISSDGTVSLHTRSVKYGKLENGMLCMVSSNLIKRLPQHHISLPIGMDLIIGKNGCIWISRTIPDIWKQEAGHVDEVTPLAEVLENLKLRHSKTPFSREERLMTSRLYNSLVKLNQQDTIISPEKIMSAYNQSFECGLQPKVSFFK